MIGEVFLWPQAWPALAAVPLVAVALAVFERSRARRRQALLGPRAPALAGSDARTPRPRRALFAAALTCGALALLQPSWGEETQRIERRGIDLVVCLDVSRSMLASDLQPSRLAHAQGQIRALAQRAHGDRLALVAFSGDARLLVPLTSDGETLADLAQAADPLSVGRGGTDLGAALETALDALAGASGDHEAVLLITDGEDHAQRGLLAAQACRERNISVHCAGFGSAIGSKIAIGDGARAQVFLRDSNGTDVITAMDADGLRAIAAATGGGFVDASRAANPLLELYETAIAPLARKAFEAEQRRGRANRYRWPLLAAFVLWLLELALAGRRARR